MSPHPASQHLALVSLVVDNYDDAIAFYCEKLGFSLVEDLYQPEQDKRWVVVRPKGANAGPNAGQGADVLLAEASTPEQKACVGNQTGGRVFLFLRTDDFWRDYNDYCAKGVVFSRDPMAAPYGTVAVFRDLYGTQWDLIGPAPNCD